MKKSFLLGFGVAAGATAYYAFQKLTADQRNKLARQFDEKVSDGRKTILKYNEYFQKFLDESQTNLEPLKDEILKKADNLANNEAVVNAYNSLKQATDELREKISQAKQEVLEEENDHVEKSDEDLQDDIVIDDRSAFKEAKDVADFKEEHPTEEEPETMLTKETTLNEDSSTEK